MDADLYDEFGIYIGPDYESDEEEDISARERETQDYDDDQDEDWEMEDADVVPMSIVFHGNKRYHINSTSSYPKPTTDNTTESDVRTGQVSNTEISTVSTTSDPAPKKGRLSGAAKKRLNWHLRQGKPFEEARALALQPVFQPTSKKLRSDGSGPLEEGKHKKKPEEALNTPSLESSHPPTADRVKCSNATKGVKLGVLHVNHPAKTLTTCQTEEALEAILDLALTPGRITPQFTGSSPRLGYCILTCANDETAQWVKSLNGKIILNDGTHIKMVGEQDLPRPVLAKGYFKGCESYPTDKILKLIMNQNNGINTEEWKVIRRTTNGPFTILVISLDNKSVEFFKRNGSSIHFRFGYAQIKIRGRKPPSDNPATTSQENWNKELQQRGILFQTQYQLRGDNTTGKLK